MTENLKLTGDITDHVLPKIVTLNGITYLTNNKHQLHNLQFGLINIEINKTIE